MATENTAPSSIRTPSRTEWPTVLVGLAIYGAFVVITLYQVSIPWYLLLPLGGFVTAWHASFQHEVIHGHPTPWRWLNHAMAAPPLLLWLPFVAYRDSHLRHHRDSYLTDPLEDPESYYVSNRVWLRLPRWRRQMLRARNTLAGRLLLGSLTSAAAFLAGQGRGLWRGDTDAWRVWTVHAILAAGLIWWIAGVCGISLWAYLLLFVWPGTALVMLRSFLEHRADDEIGRRTAIVEAGPLMSLLFLNNNLHAVHHAKPGLPWYRLPAAYARDREFYVEGNGGYRIERGYLEIVRRYLLNAKERPVHPSA